MSEKVDHVSLSNLSVLKAGILGTRKVSVWRGTQGYISLSPSLSSSIDDAWPAAMQAMATQYMV